MCIFFVSCSTPGIPGHYCLHQLGAPRPGGLRHQTVLHLLLLALHFRGCFLHLEIQTRRLEGQHLCNANIYITHDVTQNPQLLLHRCACRSLKKKEKKNHKNQAQNSLNRNSLNFLKHWCASCFLHPHQSCLWLQLFQQRSSNKSQCTTCPRANGRQTKDGNNLRNNRAFTGWKHLLQRAAKRACPPIFSFLLK